MRVMATILAVCCMALPAMASTVTYGWEDGVGTVLGKYGEMDAYNVAAPDPVNSGLHSLKLVDQSTKDAIGTPESFVAWISGLQVGDTVTASFWRYDTTPTASPSCRIWGSWGTPDARLGSAGGNSDYGAADGWGQLSNTWTAADGNTDLLIVVRTYSNDGDTVWVDDLTVEAPDTAKIVTVPEPATLALLAIGGLVALRRRRA